MTNDELGSACTSALNKVIRDSGDIEAIFERNKCTQCKKESAFLSDVCMKCAKKNHIKAMRGVK